MPYYLVTHTSLLEGENEVKAAQIVFAKLKAENQAQFVVKVDETTAHKLTVTADIASSEMPPDYAAHSQDPEDAIHHGHGEHRQGSPAMSRQSSTRCLFVGSGLFTVGIFVGLFIDLVS